MEVAVEADAIVCAAGKGHSEFKTQTFDHTTQGSTGENEVELYIVTQDFQR
jgi:hypothetical protein